MKKDPLHEHGEPLTSCRSLQRMSLNSSLGNNYVELTEDDLLDIYRKAF
ncbi:MAG: hypothetical protein ACLVB4_07940 [Butyricicoccus sp.]